MAKTTLKFKRDLIGYTLRLIYDVFDNNSTTNYLYFGNRIIKIEYLPFFFDIAKYKKTPTYPSGASDKDKEAMLKFFTILYDAIEGRKPTDEDPSAFLFSPLYDFTSYAPVATITCMVETGGMGYLRFFAPNYNGTDNTPKSFRKEDTAAYVRQYSVEAKSLIEEIIKIKGTGLEYNYRGGRLEYLTIIYLTCLLNLFPAEERNVRKGYAYSLEGRGDYDFQFLPFTINAEYLKEYYENGEFEVGTIINDLIFISSSAAQIELNRDLEASIEAYNNFTENRFPSLQAIPTALSSINFDSDKIEALRSRLLENTQFFTTAYLNFIRKVKSTTGRVLYKQFFEEREFTEQFLQEIGAEFDGNYTNWEFTYETFKNSKYIKNPLELFKDFKLKNTKVLDYRDDSPNKTKSYYDPTHYVEKYFAENFFGINSSLGSLTTENPLKTNGYQVYDAGNNVFRTDPLVSREELSKRKFGEDKITKEEAVKLVTSEKVYTSFIERRDSFKVLPKKGDIVALYNLPLILTHSYRDEALNSDAIAKAFPNYQSFKTGIDYIDNIYFESNNDVSASTIVEAMYFRVMREISSQTFYAAYPFNAFEKCFAVITQVDTESFNVLTDTITCETLVPIGSGNYAIAEFKAAYYNDLSYSQNLSYITSLTDLNYALNPENDYSDSFRLKLFINLVNTCQNNFIIPVNQADVLEEVNRNNKLKNIAGTWELKKAGGIVDVQEFVKTYKKVKVDAVESQKILDKMFDSKYKDTEVYKYFSLNMGKLFDLYKADKKGTKEILKSLNALAKYEKECIVGGELPKKEKSQIRNLIDNI